MVSSMLSQSSMGLHWHTNCWQPSDLVSSFSICPGPQGISWGGSHVGRCVASGTVISKASFVTLCIVYDNTY